MTLSSATSFVNHSPDGVETTFAYNFRVDDSSHMKVYADGVLYSEAKTVTGIGNPTGGTVVFTVAPASTITRLTLQREVTLDQQSAYPFQSPFPSASHERALDKLTMIAQQLSDEVKRAVVAPPGETSQFVLPAYQAGKFWRWNPVAQSIETVDLDAGTRPVGVNVGDLVQLVDVGGSAGLPAVKGSNLTEFSSTAANTLIGQGPSGGITSLAMSVVRTMLGGTANRILAQGSSGNMELKAAADVLTILGIASSLKITQLVDAALSTVGSYVLDNAITSSYKHYLLLLDLKPSADAIIHLRASTDNGSSWLQGAGDYIASYYAVNIGGPVGGSASSTFSLYSTIEADTGFPGIKGFLLFMNPLETTRTLITAVLNLFNNSGGVNGILIGGGAVQQASAINALQVYPSTGTITGSLKFYGIN